jgi:FkbM family methyltransferase
MKECHLFDVHEIATLSRRLGEARIRSLCESHYLGGNEVLARCLGRYKMFLDATRSAMVPHIIMDGFWEYWITQFMVATVRPGMTFVDVGANFGYYAVLLSDLVGPDGKGIAVEPNPHICSKLNKTLAINGFGERTKVEQLALGAEPAGQGMLYFPDDPMNAHIVPLGQIEAGDDAVPVPMTSIDDMCSDRVDFIKIDAEGAEAEILKGMTKTLTQRPPHLIMECNASRNYDIGALYDRLRIAYGKVSFIDFDGKPKPITARDLATRNVGHDWMIYCAPSR